MVIDKETAIAMLDPDAEDIHTFLNSHPACLVGADWTREEILDAIKHHECQLGGELCRNMNHGLVIMREPQVFVECRKGFDYGALENE